MTILSTLRERLTGGGVTTPTKPSDDGEGSAVEVPFDGYERLDDREVMKELSDHSQVELEAVENYERSNKDREPVLNKLHYMRGDEPLSGYDALSPDDVLAALKEADTDAIKRVRGYERKFANRPDILEEVMRVLHERRKSEPEGESETESESASPSAQPMSAA